MKHIPELDGVRAIAIAAVLALHGSYGNVAGGFLGVDLFFVLSGFLITTLLVYEYQSNAKIDLRLFYIRRALRIVPPLILGLLLGTILWDVSLRTTISLTQTISPIIFFYANMVDYRSLGILAHTWSLAVEEQFYFLWPMAFAILLRRGGRTALVYALSIAAIGMTLRIILVTTGSDFERIYRFTATRMDALLIGCAAGLWLTFRRAEQRMPAPNSVLSMLFISICLTVIVAEKDNVYVQTIGLTLFAICSGFFLLAILEASEDHWVRRCLRHSLLQYLGRRSYGIYIYHQPIFLAMEPLRESHNWVNWLWVSCLRVGVTLIIAEVSFRLVEKPVMALRHRFRPGGSRTAASPT